MTLVRAHPATRLRVGILGPLQADVDGRALSLGGARQRSVLAVLLLARGHVVSSERLMDALWGDRPPRSAAAGLQAYVSHLRRALEPDRPARAPSTVLVSQGPGYALRLPDDQVDAWTFEELVQAARSEPDAGTRARRLRDALALWRGPALIDFADQTWAEADAQRLTELRDVARELLLAARLDAGDAALVVPELETLLQEAPLREERWRLLALAQYRAHRQADALATLRRARTMLAEDLGVDPGPALRELESLVLQQAESLTPALAPALTPAPTPARVPTAVQAAAPTPVAPLPEDLVDRDRELAALRGCLADALAGEARIAVVEGPAGIGKTRLVTELLVAARASGALVLTGRGSQLEREFGFGVVRQLFEALLNSPERRVELMSGGATAAAGVFDNCDPEFPQQGLYGVLHGLYWLTTNLAAERPLVLAVDDVQWSDPASLRFLAYLAHRLEGLPVLLIATLRTGEVRAEEALLAEIADDPRSVAVQPSPLTRDGVALLVRQRLGDHAAEPFVTACHHTTGGNPLLLRQLLRALEAERVRPNAAHADTVRAIGSRAVSSMVTMRLSRMPPATRAVAQAVAVLGERAALPSIAALTDVDEGEVAVAVGALARAEVLRPGFPLGFVHPLVGDAVYHSIPVGERELCHERAAHLLLAGAAAPEQVAAHLLVVPRRADPAVVRVLREAAGRAAERGAVDSAVAYLRRALKEPPPVEELAAVLLDLGRLEALVDGPAAIEHLRSAYRTSTEPAQRTRAAIVLVRTLVFGGARGQATEVAATACRDTPSEMVDERQALLALERASAYMHGIAPDRVFADLPADLRSESGGLVGDGPGARALAATTAWGLLISARDRQEAVRLARFAISGDVLSGEDSVLMWVIAANVLGMAGEDTTSLWTDALARAHAQGSLFATLSAHLWGGFVQWRHGDLREALHSMSSCEDQNRMWGAPDLGQSYAGPFSVGILTDSGDLPAARAKLEEIRPRPRIGEPIRLFAEAEAALLLAEGRPADASAVLDSVQDQSLVVENPVWRPWRSLRAVAWHRLGRQRAAVELLEQDLAVARRWGAPEVVGRALRLLGEVAGDVDRVDEAVAVLERSLARHEEARARATLGRLLLDRRGAVAMEHLHRAVTLAVACGAEGVRREAAALLTAHGAPVPETDTVTRLTATERRIVERAAGGASAREIAQALFLTPRMVEETLAGVAARFGADSPPELAGVLARH